MSGVHRKNNLIQNIFEKSLGKLTYRKFYISNITSGYVSIRTIFPKKKYFAHPKLIFKKKITSQRLSRNACYDFCKV